MKKFMEKFEKLMETVKDDVKISWDDYNKFVKTFQSDEKYKQLRFGQGFIVYMKREKDVIITNPDLFYTTDRKVAEEMITKRYIKQD